MSEVIVAPGIATPQLGLVLSSEQSIRLERLTEGGPITVFGSSANDTISPVSSGGTPNLTFSGEAGNDIAFGGAGNDSFSGGIGDDVLVGGDGDDVLIGGDGADTVSGDAGNDTAQGDLGNDVMDGGAGNDTLLGGAGSDTIVGGAGNDVISGGAGKDELEGSGGRDTFRFERRSTGGRPRLRDEITDYNTRQDTIQLDRGLLPRSGLRAGRLRARDFKAVNTLGAADTAKIIYERSTGLLYYNPIRGANIALVQLPQGLNVTAADFEIF
ncbi:MAG: calcium-binding protein [Oculatellaceae cyanobacterium bins.114]|nr:calcium-binding protein [Oculatellaceae cyanobacterium bins.114]